MEDHDNANSPDRIQLHLVLPYKTEVGDHHRVRGYLERGFRIRQFQRISDREVVVTLSTAPAPTSPT